MGSSTIRPLMRAWVGRGSIPTQDVFGRAKGAEPASPGSYGLAPRGFRLPDATRLGPVRLQIADLERSLDYYQSVLGLQLLGREGSGASLGSPSNTVLLELRERKAARPVPRRGRIGLFHYALLLPDRPSLGRFAHHLGHLGVGAGASDHLVSEALYLQDPDNLGIEVYADRPRTAWRRIGRELMMATEPLDMAGLLEAAGSEPWQGTPAGTVMGHVHLHVGDLGRAATFFSETLGFDRTVRDYPGALFFAAGGYHHHLGTNMWAGRDASRPPAEEAQLLEWTLELPDESSLTAAADSLQRGGYALERQAGPGNGSPVTIRDPWGTAVRLQVAAAVGGTSRPAR
jgi:catechol 2,3-dioxygenase